MKLGRNVALWLDAMRSHGGYWYPGCGYIWDNRSSSIRLCESLVRAGLAERLEDRDGFASPRYRLLPDVAARANGLAAEARKRDGL